MSSASVTLVSRPFRVSQPRKRLWCDRLPCGHIVDTFADGTMLLCTRMNRHSSICKFFAPPASLLPKLEGGINE
jgi:hypothetical protein